MKQKEQMRCSQCRGYLSKLAGSEDLYCYGCQAFSDPKTGAPLKAPRASRSHGEPSQAVRGSDAPKNKYGAQRTTVDGEEFDSKKEAARYKELYLMRKAGEITALQRQVTFDLPGKSRYVADFVYYEVWKDCAQRGEWVVEDVKSEHTRKLPLYRLKKRQVLELYGIEIREV